MDEDKSHSIDKSKQIVTLQEMYHKVKLKRFKIQEKIGLNIVSDQKYQLKIKTLKDKKYYL